MGKEARTPPARYGRLLRTPKPWPGESLMGFILRVMESNGYDTAGWILGLSGLDHNRFGYSCPFVFREPASLTGLSTLMGVEVSELATLMYLPAESDDTSQDDQLFFGSAVPKYFIRVVDTKICPGCLRESNYCRKIWDLCAVTVCPIHRTMLLDECPNCRRRVLWSRKGVSVCACGFDWRETELPPLRECDLKVTGHIHRLCGYQFPAGEIVFDESNPILSLDLKGFLTNLLFIAGQYKNVPTTNEKIVAARVRNTELHPELSRAFAVFNNWPHNFYEFLEWRQQNNSNTPRSLVCETGLYRAFGKFYEGLHWESDTGCFELLRGAFADYVAQHWSGGHVKEKSKRGLITGAEDWKYVSKDEARRQLRTDSLRVNRYIESGRLKAVVLKSGSVRKFLVEVSSLEKLKRELSRGLNIQKTMALIGVNRHSLRQLVRAGLLEPLRGPAADGSVNWRFSRDAVDALLEKMASGISAPGTLPVGREMTFYQVMRRVSGLGVKMADFIKAILDGKITPCRVTSDVGVTRFMFKEASVARFAQAIKSGARKRLSSDKTVLAA